MSKVLKSPAKYAQGKGILKELDNHLAGIGKHLLILLSESGIKRLKPTLDSCFDGKGYCIEYEIFKGECTKTKIDGYAEKCRENGISAVIGAGGGKILDTAKGVAHYAEIPSVIIPTVCSTDSPCSSLSVMYTDDGVFDQYLFLNSCPDIVLVDTEVISKAPSRLLVAGMGDAMATFFEARACRKSGSNNQLAALPTITATEIAGLCWKYLKTDGLKAKESVEAGMCSEALENIIEVNTYQSSVGFESGGLAAAHGIQKGFTIIPELHNAYHGENVAFCTIAQLVLENAPTEELEEVFNFCTSVGLPVCFADLGYKNVDEESVMLAAVKACAPGSTIYNMPFEVTPELVRDALLKADLLGRKFRNK